MATGDFKNGTNLIGKILASQQVPGSETTVYTVPASSYTRITQGVICNVSGASVNVSLSVVPSGGTAGGTNRVISVYSLTAGNSLSLADYLRGAILGPGDFVSVLASAGSAIDITLTGVVSS
jgi:hypothetical protein